MLLWEKIKTRFLKIDKEKEKRDLSTTSNSEKQEEQNNEFNFDPFNVFSHAFETPQTNEALIKKWRQISEYPEVSEALEEIVNEAIIDEDEEILKIDLEELELPKNIKDKIRLSFEKILELLDFNLNGDRLFRKFYIDGSLIGELVYDNKKITNGIQDIRILTPINFIKARNIHTNQYLYGYTDKNMNRSKMEKFIKRDENDEVVFEEEQIAFANSGKFNEEKNIFYSHLNKALKVINQLYLIEDAIVIHRLTRAPEKRVFYIDTSGLKKDKAEQYVKGLMNKFKQRKVYDSNSGEIISKKKTVALLEDFWLPTKSDQKGTKIDTLPSTGDGMQNIDDLEYLVDKVYRALNVPRLRREKENTLQFGDNTEIEREELKFFKFVSKLRKQFNGFFLDILKKDLISTKVITKEEWPIVKKGIKLIYANNNQYSEMKKLSILEKKLNVARDMIEFTYQNEEGAKYFSHKYIRTEILGYTDDEIEEMDKQIEEEKRLNSSQEVEESLNKTKKLEDKPENIIKEDSGEELNNLLSSFDEGEILNIDNKNYIFKNGKLQEN